MGGKAERVVAVGFMSGTSLDGVDVAAIETDGDSISWLGPTLTEPYPPPLRARLRALLGKRRGQVADLEATEQTLTEFHAAAFARLTPALERTGRRAALLGFHGQTLLHRPEQHLTVQIGDGALLARLTGIATVCDFRSADVAAGGQGAPLVPVFHRALAGQLPKPVMVVNMGGVANVTWIGADDTMVAFDTGPGNAPIDDWVRDKAGLDHDVGGMLAASGTVDDRILGQLMAAPYLRRAPPKSLDRDDFNYRGCADLSVQDGAATLCEFTAQAIAGARTLVPEPPQAWILCGGGRHNLHLVARLRALLAPAAVQLSDDVKWDGDALEAQAFAYLAVRSKYGLPLSYPTTTGVPRPMLGGRMFLP